MEHNANPYKSSCSHESLVIFGHFQARGMYHYIIVSLWFYEVGTRKQIMPTESISSSELIIINRKLKNPINQKFITIKSSGLFLTATCFVSSPKGRVTEEKVGKGGRKEWEEGAEGERKARKEEGKGEQKKRGTEKSKKEMKGE